MASVVLGLSGVACIEDLARDPNSATAVFSQILVTMRDHSYFRKWNLSRLLGPVQLRLVHVLPFQSSVWPEYTPIHSNWDPVPHEDLEVL